MLHFGPFIFANPWVLTAFVVLPAIWWLLRVFPPAPERIKSPTIRLILGLQEKEPEAAKTPWWLVALRLLVISLLVLGFSHPILNPNQNLTNQGPLLLVIDDGWAAAQNWDRKIAVANNLVDQASREGRSVLIVETAARQSGAEPAPPKAMSPSDAHAELDALKPKPWPVDRKATLAVLDKIEMTKPFHVAWISNGLDDGEAKSFAERLQRFGTLELFQDRPEDLPFVLASVDGAANGFDIDVARVPTALPQFLWVNVVDGRGRLLGRVNLTVTPLKGNETQHMDMPVELRNRAARAQLETAGTVAGSVLLDDRVYRRKVGLIATSDASSAQPLLTDTHYIESAVEPFAELQTGTVKDVMESNVDIIIMTDADVIAPDVQMQLESWIKRGGLLLQFAGPRLANHGNELLPVHLRDGTRALGGAMTWSSPAKLAPFDRTSPFYGLALPGDVEIRQQVLADPSPDLTDKTWAKLEDGTPLITAAADGKGWTVLFHTTANPDWSNLPLSGLFVDMMQRIIGMATGVAQTTDNRAGASGSQAQTAPAGEQMLRPVNTMDAFGQLGPPMAGAQPIAAHEFRTTAAGPDHPPGIYEASGVRRALNLASPNGPIGPNYTMKAIENLPGGVILSHYDSSHETDLRAALLITALVLALADLGIALFLGGRLTGIPRMILIAGVLGAVCHAGHARAADGVTPEQAALSLHLAYVRTGDPSVDQTSRMGLQGLSDVLRIRTSVRPDEPIGLSVARDPLTFFPLIYWPVLGDAPIPTDATLEKIRAYLRNGGTILFDTRDGDGSPALSADAVAPPATLALRKLLAALGRNRLDPPGPDHVLTRSFYLTRWFPGLYADGQIWLDPTPSDIRDGVSSIIAGGNDWAAAWALNSRGEPTNVIVDNGGRQREMAFRFGINLVMYVLTGNYKSDQVHVPFLLERLGRRRLQ